MPIVVFDTNVIEGRYITPLLKGEPCRDFESLRDAGYWPAVHVKSFYEICNHIKRGNHRFPWMDAKLGFPGGIEEGKRILRESPDLSIGHNIHWMFGICEEWRDLEWDEHASEMSGLIASQERDSVREEIEVRRQFAAWKYALTGFCELIWETLSREMKIITCNDLFGEDPMRVRKIFALEQELALTTLIPSEDFEILVAALMMEAAGFVTQEKEILAGTALSLSLDHKTAFLHPDQLVHAIRSKFEVRWSFSQTSSRGTTDV